MKEIEIKLPVKSLPALRGRLRRLGFERITTRLLERNLVFDTPQATLRRSSELLRLRSKGRQWWLTWKARPETGSRHKIRQEIEVETRQGVQLAEILRRLGYQPSFEYHKYRTEYHARAGKGKALLDETPIGNFLELEGPPGWIDGMAGELGYRPEDYILDSYGALYLAWCRQRGLAPGHMVFAAKKSLRPREP